jgi:hypothetical protein
MISPLRRDLHRVRRSGIARLPNGLAHYLALLALMLDRLCLVDRLFSKDRKLRLLACKGK